VHNGTDTNAPGCQDYGKEAPQGVRVTKQEIAVKRPQEAEVLPSPTCPLCHTLDHTITNADLAAGAAWRCARCGQTWSAERLATAAAYARYAS